MKILNIALEGLFDVSQSYNENNLIKAQINDGHDVYILASTRKTRSLSDEKYSETKETVYNKAHLIRKNISFKNFLLFGKIIDADIDSILESIKPDLIVIHGLSSYVIRHVYLYKHSHKNVFVIGINHLDEVIFDIKKLKNKLYRIKFASINKKYGDCVNCLYGVTQGRVEFLKHKLGFKSRDVKLAIMGGIEPTLSQKTFKEATIEVDKSLFYFYSGGKLDANKGAVQLIKAFNDIRQENIRLVLFGEIEAKCKESVLSILEHDKRIIQLPWLSQDQINYLIDNLNCAVFPGQHSVLWEQILFRGKTGIFGNYKGVEHIFMFDNAIKVDKNCDSNTLKQTMTKVLNDENGLFTNACKNANEHKKEYDIQYIWQSMKEDVLNGKN